ncbi:MAG: endonuclease III [Candidatus Moranbacteria bacterium]|nr:endonuclease III [Candidatus Moranbacteria bacterium]
MTKKERLRQILALLRKEYCPRPEDFILFSNPLELVVGTVLSAQCTDKRVNMVTQDLFLRYQTAFDYANASLFDLEKIIFSTGFYRSKAKYLKGIGKVLTEKFDGKVPDRLEDLLLLPGVSTKTAYLVLSKGFGKDVGVAVDTHVLRLSGRLGLSKSKNPDQISRDLFGLVRSEDFLFLNEGLILHGRAVCLSRAPKCSGCVLFDLCPSGKKFALQKK